MNWLPFWDHFETEIDKQVIDKQAIILVTFLYLQQFYIPEIYGFPLTPGYTKVKPGLLTKYGKPNVLAYIEVTNSLPVLKGTNPNVIHAFYEKSLLSVLTLEAIKMVMEKNGFVQIILCMLPGTRGGLV